LSVALYPKGFTSSDLNRTVFGKWRRFVKSNEEAREKKKRKEKRESQCKTLAFLL